MKRATAALLVLLAAGAIPARAQPAAARTDEHARELFLRYCALCHGESGDGNGRMRSVIVSPPPADLRASILCDQAAARIIRRGGAAVGRSPSMPAWGDQLTERYVRELVNYLRTLRNSTPAQEK